MLGLEQTIKTPNHRQKQTKQIDGKMSFANVQSLLQQMSPCKDKQLLPEQEPADVDLEVSVSCANCDNDSVNEATLS